ncbi:MAG: Kup system potassium uptake protein [uncultured Paraburkholderia sp.]|uniref:potassium transporter Kup n=1 Tax=uncultured Paraburkholderia sp. TaxID=1822466 RepID=UPI0025947869|nr:potassium transporter Kup [uncultured Paraburkholderia sp.]CAH2901525.1 MAG: Kup system potassium uptake protein [uncultured Paraburkholderia sp.]CAH2934600.1 MAG: Kup system potassium uptake protein [uncultured Paraburkholderia sp.]
MTTDSNKNSMAALTLAAIGIVYGDIGTSPLYTMKEVFAKHHGLSPVPVNVLGVVSLILWGLIIVISLKYVTLVLRADNRGEGGIMAMTALALSSVTQKSRWYYPVMLLGMVGAGLFFGDGVITPAISVLSAIEGLEVAAPALKPYVIPVTLAVLVALYLLQRRGTAGIGKWFGPIVLVWFITLAAMGVANIAKNPFILIAFNPLHALGFLIDNGWLAFVALGAVVLALTGAEALYADMGHFGKKTVRLAWFSIVAPALALNYLGQGALLLSNPAAVSNPFFLQLGPWSVYPLVVLSTMATVIASQATISGAFSVTQQAIALGFLPRMRIRQTSESHKGQIYIPLVNWLQLTAVILAVVGFGSSSNLASAYGIAATATMLTTTLLTFFVVRFGWKFPLLLSVAATGFFLTIDVALFSSTSLKIISGGWFTLTISALMVMLMLTWRRGRELVFQSLQRQLIPLDDFLQSLFINPPLRVPGTAVFFRAEGDGVPHALLHNLLHNQVLHERTIFLTVYATDIPRVPDRERIKVVPHGHNCYQVNVYYGFSDERDIPRALQEGRHAGLSIDPMQTSFFIARQTVLATPKAGMALWREALYSAMSRNARDAADYFKIPPNRVIELGAQVEI